MAEYICSKCHYVGKPRYRKRGSGKTEFIMWAMFPLGIPYTIYRMFGKTKICKECSGDILVDTESMLGMKLVAASEAEILDQISGTKSKVAMPPIVKPAPEIFKQPDALPVDETPPPEPAPKPRTHQDPNQW